MRGILSRTDVDVTFTVDDRDGRVVFDLRGPDAALVIGRQGQTLDALQLLVNRMVTANVAPGGEEAAPPILLDSDGYRARREESLIGMAARLADQAVRTRRPVAVEGLSPAERRVVHTALAGRGDVRTESQGAEPHRTLRIVPASEDSGSGEPAR